MIHRSQLTCLLSNMKTWQLDCLQCVSIDSHRNVYFKHRGRNMAGITLSWRQFLNLNDVMKDLATFRSLLWYPLGNFIWLQYYNNHIQLYHCRLKIYFSFRDVSWYKYINETHHHILAFIRHGTNKVHGRQRHATDETLFQNRSRLSPPTSPQQQVLPRTPTHVSVDTQQRAKYTNLQKRDSADTGRPFSFIGAVHALGAAPDSSSDMEEGEVCHVGDECQQFSDFCTIE